MSADDRALIAAMELLRRQMADLPMAIVQNLAQYQSGRATRGAPGAPVGGGTGAGSDRFTLTSGITTLGLQFAKLLGPLVALHTFLSASTSGFSVFSKAMQLFAATIAPVLMPAFFLLAVALAATSEVIFTKMMPALETFFSLILSTGIPAVAQFVEDIGRAADALKDLSSLDLGIGGIGGGDLGAALGAGPLGFFPGGGALLRAARPEGDAAGARGATTRAVRDTLAELRLSMGPAASTGTIASIASRAQLAALQSPFERRMLDMMERVTRAMERAAGGEVAPGLRAPGAGVAAAAAGGLEGFLRPRGGP